MVLVVVADAAVRSDVQPVLNTENVVQLAADVRQRSLADRLRTLNADRVAAVVPLADCQHAVVAASAVVVDALPSAVVHQAYQAARVSVHLPLRSAVATSDPLLAVASDQVVEADLVTEAVRQAACDE